MVKCMCSHPITFTAPSQLAAIFYLYTDLAGEASKLAAVLSAALQFPQFWYSFRKRLVWKLFCNIPKGEKIQKTQQFQKTTGKKKKRACSIHHFKMWQFPYYSTKSQVWNLNAVKCTPCDTDWAGCTRISDVNALLKADKLQRNKMCPQRCCSCKAWKKGHTIIYHKHNGGFICNMSAGETPTHSASCTPAVTL